MVGTWMKAGRSQRELLQLEGVPVLLSVDHMDDLITPCKTPLLWPTIIQTNILKLYMVSPPTHSPRGWHYYDITKIMLRYGRCKVEWLIPG